MIEGGEKDHISMLKSKASNLPHKPGVYIYEDANGKVLYIGKARSLHQRVNSYFSKEVHGSHISKMLQRAWDIQHTVTATEREALILEASMIKHHHPKYNIALKDDKRFPYLKITNEPYPRILMVRKTKDDGASYFGPFTSGPIKRTQRHLRGLFKLRACNKLLPKGCLYGDMGSCLAPCRGDCTDEEYDEAVKEAQMYLRGEHGQLSKLLEKRMKELSGQQRYEEAAAVRDQLKAISRLASKQHVDLQDQKDRDAIALRRMGSDRAMILHYSVRKGLLVAQKNIVLQVLEDSTPSQIVSAFIGQYYQDAKPPREIILPMPIEDEQMNCDWLSSLSGGKVVFTYPQRGVKKKLLEMMDRNLATLLSTIEIVEKEDHIYQQSAKDLKKWLELDELPVSIEGYDISTIQGSYSVGAKVRFENGKTEKAGYRRYRIKSFVGQDDFAAIEEVISRRMEHIDDDPLPDIILIDGGKGQLSAAIEAAGGQVAGTKFISLAKKQEDVFVPKEQIPITLPNDSPAKDLLVRVRDEVHRFAITYHRKIRKKGQTSSLLDTIPGLGPVRKKALMLRFGSVNEMRRAAADEIAKVSGIGPKTAEVIYRSLRKGK